MVCAHECAVDELALKPWSAEGEGGRSGRRGGHGEGRAGRCPTLAEYGW